MSDEVVKVLGLVLAIGGGGLAGSLVMRSFASRRAKLDLAISLVRDFMGRYDDFGVALYALGQVSNGKAISQADRNRVLSIGDWLETAYYLAAKGHCASGVLMEVGLTEQARRFRGALVEAGRADAVLAGKSQNWQYLSKA